MRDAGELYELLAPGVLAYLRSQRVDDAEDLLGEVFLQVTRGLSSIEDRTDEEVRRWVYTVARHRVIDAARRRATRPVLPRDVLPDHGTDDRIESLDTDVAAALADLTPDQREVIVLRFVADLSIEDVAALTERSVTGVKALQHRALARMGKHLGEEVTPGGVSE